MIAKEKKQAIIAEYARTPGDTGSPEVQIAILTGINRAFEGESQGSPFQTWTFKNGRSETWSAGLFEEGRY